MLKLLRDDRNKVTWKFYVLIVVIGMLASLIGAALSAQIFVTPGPQGDKGDLGDTGSQGPQGEQGLQGIPGEAGTDAILQIIQRRNVTPVDIDGYTGMQWFNLSIIDSSMEIIINVQQNSKLLVQFSSSHRLEPPAAIWMRIVVDGTKNSSNYVCSTGPPASGVYTIPGHTEYLTDLLNAGLHVITVQFLRESGAPNILERTFTVIELTT